MATEKELQDKIKKLNAGILSPKTADSLKQKLQEELNKTEMELANMNTPATNPPMPVAGQGSSQMLQSMMGTLSAIMASGSGSVDTPQVREIIKKYLNVDKVKLSELDQSVLDEIKKNQEIVLNLPNFAKEIKVSKTTARIPNFYEIIDDVLAGNNVYLIGEAGGGKTYTAEQIAITLGIEYVTLNCSQYTSPLEILGGQSVEGFKQGKLIDCWKNGKILILDEMPKLDPNTAGLFNDALAKSTKTKKNSESKINSANTEEPPIERANNFAVIATGNIYPNEPPAPQYRGNNQQDLSLLDRFSGSVYYTEFNKNTDEITSRFKFLYDFLVGNYYEYITAKSTGQAIPPARGLRTIIESLNAKNLALVSYRTNTAFRVAFEYQLVREIAKRQGKTVIENGKTLAGTFKSYMVAFKSSPDTYNQILNATKYTEKYINNLVEDNIDKILSSKQGFKDSFNPIIKDAINLDTTFGRYEDFFVGEVKIEQ
jgi:cobaltochelatase CobS